MLFISLKYCPRVSRAAWTSRSSQDHHISRRPRFPRVCPISPPFQGLNPPPPHNPSISIDARHEQQRQSRPSPQKNPHSPPSDPIMNDDYLVWFRRIGQGGKGYHASRTIIAVVHDIVTYLATSSQRSNLVWSGGGRSGWRGSCWRKSNSVYIHNSITLTSYHQTLIVPAKKEYNNYTEQLPARLRSYIIPPPQPHERKQNRRHKYISRVCLCM
jgi:hypothetical protein